MVDIPNWFDEHEYSDFLAESQILFEFNVPLQKQKIENRKKLWQFRANKARQEGILRMELARDAARAKAKGLQMGMGESFQAKLMNKFLDKLMEERTPIKAEKRKMRPEVDPADRERDRKRESRRQDGQESEYKRIVIVKNNRRNKIEIIPKDDYDSDYHTLLKGKVKKQDKGNVTPRDLRYYSKMDNFINTKTSVRLIGKVKKQTEETTGKSKVKSKKTKESKQEVDSFTPEPPTLRVPKDGKEITDPTSTYPDWDHDNYQLIATIPQILNTFSGGQMPTEFQQAIVKSRTLGDALTRFSSEISNEYPSIAQLKFSQPESVLKTGKSWSKMGMKTASPNCNVIGTSKDGKSVGFAIKIGEQIRPTNKEDMNAALISCINSIPAEQLQYVFKFFIDDFIENLRRGFFAIPTPPPMQMITQSGSVELAKQKWLRETVKTQKQKLLDKAHDVFERFVNEDETIKSAFLLECLSGNIKFDGKTGSAQVMMTAKKDGSDTTVADLNAEFTETLAKSEDTNLSFKFTKTIPAKDGFLESVLNKITLNLNENAMDAVADIQKIKDQLSNPLTFLQVFEMTVEDAVYKTPILYSEFIGQANPDTVNTIILNYGSDKETEIQIPVKINYNPEGRAEKVIEKGADNIFEEYLFLNDYLVEQVKKGNIDLLDSLLFLEEEFNILNERNYRKEYDNYHSRPEQRANRSKRVLARRKLEDEGRVKKGDGNDVHHEDGNPQNNSDDNLSVMDKSKNRSMNEEHGAGFEGTDELLQNLVDQTPLANNPVKSKLAKYIEDRYVKKLKKK